MKLKKLNIIGELFFDLFKNGGKEETETSKDDYKKLNKAERTPAKSGKSWHYSYSDNKYDSSSNRLENKCYYELPDHFVVKKDNKEVSVTKDKIVNDEISDSYLEEIISEKR